MYIKKISDHKPITIITIKLPSQYIVTFHTEHKRQISTMQVANVSTSKHLYNWPDIIIMHNGTLFGPLQHFTPIFYIDDVYYIHLYASSTWYCGNLREFHHVKSYIPWCEVCKHVNIKPRLRLAQSRYAIISWSNDSSHRLTCIFNQQCEI